MISIVIRFIIRFIQMLEVCKGMHPIVLVLTISATNVSILKLMLIGMVHTFAASTKKTKRESLSEMRVVIIFSEACNKQTLRYLRRSHTISKLLEPLTGAKQLL
jgi:hypothetical protein